MSKFEGFDQEAIYNRRYDLGYTGMGSPVNTLTAERLAIAGSVRRLQKVMPEGSDITIVDYGYGVGRVPNELVSTWVGPGNLTVVAYDVSRSGLHRAFREMREHHLTRFKEYEDTHRFVGECTSTEDDTFKRTIRFIHGKAKHKPHQIADILIEENGGNPFDIATSWYDPISHEPSAKRRRQLFGMLGSLTHIKGEVIVTASTIGDLVPEYASEGEDILEDEIDEHGERDVVYATESGVNNYLHLYGPDFENCMRATRTDIHQKLWLQPIRMLGKEYTTSVEERQAYGELRRLAQQHSRKRWRRTDYESIHTVGGFRSYTAPEGQLLLKDK